MLSLVRPNTRSLTGELLKTKLLHQVSEAPEKLSEMSQNPAALKNGCVSSSTRKLERRSRRGIIISWDGSISNLCSPQGDTERPPVTLGPQESDSHQRPKARQGGACQDHLLKRSRTRTSKKYLAKHYARITGPNTFDSYAS